MAHLEHVNLTVSDPKAMAAMLGDLFGWQVRWEGGAIHGGYSIHVGGVDDYVALYSGPGGPEAQIEGHDNYRQRGGLNHIGIVVDDLDAVEKKVIDKGYQTHSHADYEPGRRFYFHAEDGVEIEVITYD